MSCSADLLTPGRWMMRTAGRLVTCGPLGAMGGMRSDEIEITCRIPFVLRFFSQKGKPCVCLCVLLANVCSDYSSESGLPVYSPKKDICAAICASWASFASCRAVDGAKFVRVTVLGGSNLYQPITMLDRSSSSRTT